MTVWMVRHGCAGAKDDWSGPDDVRPLDDAGAHQAAAISELLTPERPVRLLSSPTVRCVDTLRSTAERVGLPILQTDRLAVPAHPTAVLDLLANQPGRTVLCTHGEVMAPLLPIFRGVGFTFTGAASDDEWLRKGVVWCIDREAMSLSCRVPEELVECVRHPGVLDLVGAH